MSKPNTNPDPNSVEPAAPNRTPNSPEALGEALRDERALRFFAQQQEAKARQQLGELRALNRRLAQQVHKLEHEIKRLSSEPDELPAPTPAKPTSPKISTTQRSVGPTSVSPKLTSSATVSTNKDPDQVTSSAESAEITWAPTDPVFPYINAGLVANGGLVEQLAEHFTTTKLDHTAIKAEQIGSLDLILLQLSAIVQADQNLRKVLGEWVKLPGRGRLVIELDTELDTDRGSEYYRELQPLLTASDLWVSDRSIKVERAAERSLSQGSDVPRLEIPFLFHPAEQRPTTPPNSGRISCVPHSDLGGIWIWERKSQPMVVLLENPEGLDRQTRAYLSSVASGGIPVLTKPTEPTGRPAPEQTDQMCGTKKNEDFRLWLGNHTTPTWTFPSPDDLVADLDRWWEAAVLSRRYFHSHFASPVAVSQLLDLLQFPHPPLSDRVGILLMTHRPQLVPAILNQITGWEYPNLEIQLGCHGFDPTEISSAISRIEPNLPELHLHQISAETSLGEGLNLLASAGSASILAKIDDDDFYGAHYLVDAVQALAYSRAEVVGKATQYVYLSEEDATYLILAGGEEQYRPHINGPTLVFRRRLWERAPFAHRTRGIDSYFLRGARRLGAPIYANSRKEFVLFRHREGHTYQTPSEQWSSRGKQVWPGHQPDLAQTRPNLSIGSTSTLETGQILAKP